MREGCYIMEEVIYLQGEVICIKEVVFGLPDDFTSFFMFRGVPGKTIIPGNFIYYTVSKFSKTFITDYKCGQAH